MYRSGQADRNEFRLKSIIAYGSKRWPALCRFLNDGRLKIDNNIAERALRGIAVD